jgi:replicative DNA helicase
MKKSPVINLDKGRIPPQAIKLEASVLGALIVDARAADEVFGFLPTEDVFYKEDHWHIFRAIQALYEKSNPIDLLTVSNQLKIMGKLEAVGGDFALIQLTQTVASSAHIEYHSRILIQKFIMRKVIAMNNQIIALAYDDATDCFELLENYQKQFDNLTDLTISGRKTMSFPDALQELKLDIERHSANTDDLQMVGVPTGFKSTDKHTGGYREGDLVILAARPGMGKTSKVLKTVVENVKQGNAVGFISLEMSMKQLAARIVAIDTNFHLKQILKTGFEKLEYFQTYDAHCKRMNEYALYVDDSGTNDLTEIVIRAKAWKRSQGIKLLVIDYLQLMDDKSVKGNNREAVTSAISRRLKLLAKELEIPIIALSQLSRAVETRGGSKRPLLSDLRDSGAIEQDADIVEFIYRPSYYKVDIDSNDYDDRNQRLIGLGADSEINYAKYRGGSTATTLLKWVGDKTKFIDVDDEKETLEYIDRPLPKASTSEAFGVTETVFDAK